MKRNPILGRSSFALEALHVPRSPFLVSTECLACGEAFSVRRGEIRPVFRVGAEVVGLCCDNCLSASTRAALARIREQVMTR